MRRRSGRVLSRLVALAALGIATPSMASTVSQDLTVEAGLASALTIDCSRPLSMGRIALPSGARGGIAYLTLSSLPDLQEINVDTGLEPANAAVTILGGSSNGGCSISGGVPGTCVKPVSQDLEDNGYVVTLEPADVLGLPASETNDTPFSNFIVFREPTFRQPIEFDANGEASFGIGAGITIRDNLTTTDFGGFAAAITVTMEDVACP